MPYGRRIKSNLRSGGFGKLLEKKGTKNKDFSTPDHQKTLTIKEKNKFISLDDFISTRKQESRVDESTLDEYLTNFKFAIPGPDEILIRKNQTLTTFEGESKIFDTLTVLDSQNVSKKYDLIFPKRRFKFHPPVDRITAFLSYVGEAINYFEDCSSKNILDELEFNYELDLLKQRFCDSECESDELPFDDCTSGCERFSNDENDCKVFDKHAEESQTGSDDSEIEYEYEGNNEEKTCLGFSLSRKYYTFKNFSGKFSLVNGCKALASCTNRSFFLSSVFNYFCLNFENAAPYLSKSQIVFTNNRAFSFWRKTLESSLDQIRKSSSENICITPFERNLNFWEQLWRTVEFSDVLLIIIDARSPLLFFNILFYNYVQELGKQPIVLLNKCDYLSEYQKFAWKDFFEKRNLQVIFYSSLQALRNENTIEVVSDEENYHSLVNSTVTYSSDELLKQLELIVEPIRVKKQQQRENAKKARILLESFVKKHFSNNDELDQLSQDIHKTLNQFLADKEMCSEGSYNNQSDYVSNWVGNANLLESSTVAVGLVGFPNVGKSTVINSIIRPRLNKNVKVSSTPGKTKFLQTFMLLENGITLIDSPGLIFPIAAKSKADLVINGILNINTWQGSCLSVVRCILSRIPSLVFQVYRIKDNDLLQKSIQNCTDEVATEVLNIISKELKFYKSGKGGLFDIERTGRRLIQQYIKGRIFSFCEICPDSPQDQWLQEERKKFKIDI